MPSITTHLRNKLLLASWLLLVACSAAPSGTTVTSSTNAEEASGIAPVDPTGESNTLALQARTPTRIATRIAGATRTATRTRTATPRPTLVAVRIYPPGGSASEGIEGGIALPANASYGQGDNGPLITFAPQLWFRAVINDRDVGSSDGAGISEVRFTILDGNGNVVHQRNERTPGYCVFGGGEPSCNVWDFAANDNAWPDGTPLDASQTFTAQMEPVLQDSNKNAFWFFNFRIEEL